MERRARRCWRVPAREGGRSSQGSGRSWTCAQSGDGGVARGVASAASFSAGREPQPSSVTAATAGNMEPPDARAGLLWLALLLAGHSGMTWGYRQS